MTLLRVGACMKDQTNHEYVSLYVVTSKRLQRRSLPDFLRHHVYKHNATSSKQGASYVYIN